MYFLKNVFWIIFNPKKSWTAALTNAAVKVSVLQCQDAYKSQCHVFKGISLQIAYLQ